MTKVLIPFQLARELERRSHTQPEKETPLSGRRADGTSVGGVMLRNINYEKAEYLSGGLANSSWLVSLRRALSR